MEARDQVARIGAWMFVVLVVVVACVTVPSVWDGQPVKGTVFRVHVGLWGEPWTEIHVPHVLPAGATVEIRVLEVTNASQ